MATFIEAKPFIELMPFSSINQIPFPAVRLEDATLVVSSMEKVNTAMATAYGCMTYKPDHVFNFGAAGVTSNSLLFVKVCDRYPESPR
jgi:nucleoside phosphorylase